MAKKQKRSMNTNNLMIILLVVTMLGIGGAIGFNIYRVAATDTGSGTTDTVQKVSNEYSNEYYTIGNNPTDINKTYFKEINAALKEEDNVKIAESLAKTFVTEYYTWTNKDGNYDVGGIQYIYTPKQSDFETYTLNNFYEDMDLYLTQVTRSDLIEVKEVTVNSSSEGTYGVQADGQTDEAGNPILTELNCVSVDLSWTYESSNTLNTSEFQSHAIIHVVDNNGRWEIAGIEG